MEYDSIKYWFSTETARWFFMDILLSVQQMIMVNNCGKSSEDLIAICQIIPGHVSWQAPTLCWPQIIASVKFNVWWTCTFIYQVLHRSFEALAATINNCSQMCQGSTLTVVHLGIPSSFCCRTTWTSVYGCPLVKLRKLIKLAWSVSRNVIGALENVNISCACGHKWK